MILLLPLSFKVDVKALKGWPFDPLVEVGPQGIGDGLGPGNPG